MNKTEIMEVIAAVFTSIVILVVCIMVGYLVSKQSCYSKWQESFDTRFAIFQGCQIKVGGKWIPSESYYFKQE